MLRLDLTPEALQFLADLSEKRRDEPRSAAAAKRAEPRTRRAVPAV